MIHIEEAVIVEGKYDKIKLSNFLDAMIVETGGFAIYKDKKRLQFIRRLAMERGIIILTDSDHSGFQIRNYIAKGLPPQQVKHLYIPDVYGKEHRKQKPSKEGKLGVEGMRPQVILDALRRAGATFAQQDESEAPVHPVITKADFYEWGLSGRPDSTARRAAVLHALDLPAHMTANALLEFINAVGTHEQVAEIIQQYVEKIEE